MPFARALAACLIVLALSPFTAPFAVCELRDLVAHPGAPVPPQSRSREFDQWFVDGACTLDLPLVPVAAEMKASAVTLALVDVADDAPRAPLAAASRQSAGAIRSPLSLVLRL